MLTWISPIDGVTGDSLNTSTYVTKNKTNIRSGVCDGQNSFLHNSSVICLDDTQLEPGNESIVDQPIGSLMDHSPISSRVETGNVCRQEPRESAYQLGMPLQSRPILRSGGTTLNSADAEVTSQNQHFLGQSRRKNSMR